MLWQVRDAQTVLAKLLTRLAFVTTSKVQFTEYAFCHLKLYHLRQWIVMSLKITFFSFKSSKTPVVEGPEIARNSKPIFSPAFKGESIRYNAALMAGTFPL